MSDAPSVQASMHRALHRCTGGPDCPCGGAASTGSSPTASPSASRSRSRSTSNGVNGSGDSSHHTSSQDGSSSSGDSESLVPKQEWSGLEIVRVPKCEHDRHGILKKCWGGKNTGRRFLGCPLKCQFVQWLDDEWPGRVQAALKSLWKELKITRRCEATSNTSLIEAIKLNDAIKKEKKELQEAVDRTKRVAEKVCATYQRKAAYATVDKSKLMYLISCLIGVIFFLVAVIFFKM